jgi:hypothetical protein
MKVKFRKIDEPSAKAFMSEGDYLTHLRKLREAECFSVVNRGALWYDTLDEFQKIELADYYQKWLDVTKTLKIPEKPSWLR